MQCFICGEQMRVVMVEPHVIDMQGFELRTFKCVGCGDTEKHPVFDSTRSVRAPVVMPEAIAARANVFGVSSSHAAHHLVEDAAGGLLVQFRVGGLAEHVLAPQHLEQVELDVTQVALVVTQLSPASRAGTARPVPVRQSYWSVTYFILPASNEIRQGGSAEHSAVLQ